LVYSFGLGYTNFSLKINIETVLELIIIFNNKMDKKSESNFSRFSNEINQSADFVD